MNELEKIAEKDRNGEVLNPVEVAIYWVWNDTHTNMGIAYEAAVANAAMQARIEKMEAGLRRIVNGEYDNARTIDAAEKFARELLRGDK